MISQSKNIHGTVLIIAIFFQPLQVENCHSNSLLVVNENDKFRFERVNVGPASQAVIQHWFDTCVFWGDISDNKNGLVRMIMYMVIYSIKVFSFVEKFKDNLLYIKHIERKITIIISILFRSA